MTFEDLKGCLILISYDTVRPEDEESQTWHNVLPYAFEDGCLLRYELDGDDDIDHTIDPDNFAGGKESIRKAPKQPSEPEQERTYTSEELSNIGESLV